MRLEGQAVKVANEHAEWLFQNTPSEGDESRPEIDRSHLRQIFLDVIGDPTARDTHVKSITRLPGGGYELFFADGNTQTFDLVIGADGSFSTVRSLVTSVRPGYTGLHFCEMYLNEAMKMHPAEAATVDHGSVYTLGDAKGIFAQTNTSGKIRVYAILGVPEYWSKQVGKEYDWGNPRSEAR